MAVTDFDTKVAVVVRDDLAVWQKLNVTAFLISGVIADAGEDVVGEDYLDADGARYLPLLVQPVLIYSAGGEKLQTVRRRAADRDVSAGALHQRAVRHRPRRRQPRRRAGGSDRAASTSSGSRCVLRTATPTPSCAGSSAIPSYGSDSPAALRAFSRSQKACSRTILPSRNV